MPATLPPIGQGAKRERATASEAVKASRLDECLASLNQCLGEHEDSPTLHRFRSRLHLRKGSSDAAVWDARRAVALERSADSLVLHARCLHRSHNSGRSLGVPKMSVASVTDLRRAGEAYLEAGDRSALAPSVVHAYDSLLDAVRRERSYFRPDRGRRRHLPRVGRNAAPVATHSNIFGNHHLDKPRPVSLFEPEAPELGTLEVATDSISLEWAEPEDGGDEIYKYEVRCAPFTITWHKESSSFSEGFPQDTAAAYEGPGDVRLAVLRQLLPGHEYEVRIKARNSVGDSDWSIAQTIKTKTPIELNNQAAPLPASWLRISVSDLVEQQKALVPESTMQSFFSELGEVLRGYVTPIKLVFKDYASPGTTGSEAAMQANAFLKFCKDAGLLQASGWAKLKQKKAGIGSPMGREAAQLLFQRANMNELQGRGAGNAEAARLAAESVLGAVDFDAEVAEADSGGVDGLVCSEYVGALVRLAWTCCTPAKPDEETPLSVGGRLRTLISNIILPMSESLNTLGGRDRQEVSSPYAAAVIAHYRQDIELVFGYYAAADKSSMEALQADDSLNLDELLMMLKDAEQLDASLSAARVGTIFKEVNSASEAAGEDDDDNELTLEEFLQIFVRLGHAKLRGGGEGTADSEAAADGKGFAVLLAAWLEELMGVYKRVIRDKKRGA